jgi:hypothetical protein
MVNNIHLLIWCSFDPDANTQTHKRFFFIWPSLQSREFLKSDNRFGLPDRNYPRSNYVPTINGQLLLVTKIDVLLTFEPKFVPGFGLPDPDYTRPDYVPTINGQQLLASKIDVLLTPMQTHKQTHRQTIFVYMTLPTVEGIFICKIFRFFLWIIFKNIGENTT